MSPTTVIHELKKSAGTARGQSTHVTLYVLFPATIFTVGYLLYGYYRERWCRRDPPKIMLRVALSVPLAGCVLDLNKLAKDIAKPSVSFEQPTAWACADIAKFPTKQAIEECSVCRNAKKVVQTVTVNKQRRASTRAKRVSLSLDGRGRRPGGAAMRRLPLVVALLVLVGCAGHQPRVVNVRSDTPAHPRSTGGMVIESVPRDALMAYLNVDADAQHVTWLSHTWDVPSGGSMTACPGSLKLCETIDMATCREIAQP